jgi:hypothetical protein
MALRKKASNLIAIALKAVDDKAEFNATEEVDEQVQEVPNTFEQPLMLSISPAGVVVDEKKEVTMNDFAKLFNSEDDSGLSYFDDSQSIGENTYAILRKVVFGLTEWEYKFLAAYSLLPSLFCKILPIVEINGQAGTGKSQLLIAMSKISGNGVISGQSTGASLKNYINVIRWADPETKNTEKNCLLFVDNLNEDCFKKEEYLSSFLNGYSRATDRTFISNGKGENIEFKTFCGKVYSTIWERNSTELHRRTVTIKTQKVENLDNSLEPDDVSWQPLRNAIAAFWGNSKNWQNYGDTYKLYAKTVKPKHSKEHWTLLRDVMVTGVVTGVWIDLDSAIADTAHWLETALKTRQSLLETVILRALEEVLGIQRGEWEELSKRLKIHVPPRHLKDAIEQSVADGLIERPKLAQVQQILAKLGFTPGKKDSQLGYTYVGKRK